MENVESIDLTKFSVIQRLLPEITYFFLLFLLNMLESDMKDFSCTLPLGNSEKFSKFSPFFQKLLNFSSKVQ